MSNDPWAAFNPQADLYAAFNPQPAGIGDFANEALGNVEKYTKGALTGAMYGGQRASAGLTGLLPNAVRKFLESKGMSPTNEQLQQSRAATQEAGLPGTLGQMTADVGSQMLPSSMLTKATAGLTMGRNVLSRLAGEGAINSAMTPDSEDRGIGALIGAGGAGTGMAASRALGGLAKNAVSAEGRQLLDAGLPVTPGQVISGSNAGPIANALRSTEDKIGSIPLVGDVVRSRTRNAANAFSTQQINDALAPIGQRIEGVGHAALDSAHNKITQSYSHVLPEIHVPNTALPNLVNDAIALTKSQDGFFNDINEKVLRTFEEGRLLPLHGSAGGNAGRLTGEQAKKLDQEIGEKIRDYRKSGNVQDTITMKALINLRDGLRASMVGTTPEARLALQNADKARARLQPMLDAAHPTTGEFTAAELVKQIDKHGRPTDLQRAAATVMPSKTPDSGTAGRALLAKVLASGSAGAGAAGAGGTLGAAVWPLAAGAAGAMGLYTKPGMQGLTEGVGPMVNALRRKSGLPPISGDELEQAIQSMVQGGSRSLYNTTQGQ